MQTVDESGIVELWGQRLEEVAVLQHEGHVVVGVADEGKAGLSPHGIDPAGEGLVGHIVLHDVDQRLVGGLLAAGKLVKGDNVPVPHEANSAVGIVDKELRNRDALGFQPKPTQGDFQEPPLLLLRHRHSQCRHLAFQLPRSS